MTYEVLRMPKEEQAITSSLEEVSPFILSMYPEEEQKIHGEFAISFENFLFLWDNGGLFLLTKRDEQGKLLLVAMCSQYRDLWSNRPRVEVQRVSMLDMLDEQFEIDSVVKYLKGVAGLLKFDQLFFNEYYPDGSVMRKLIWNDKG